MATYRAQLLTNLEDDATLTTLLTGGVYDSNSLPDSEITATNLPDVWTGASSTTLKPFAAVTWRESNSANDALPVETRFFEIYVYGNSGYTAIDSVMNRLKAMFHNQNTYRLVGVEDADSVYIRYLNESEDFREPTLLNKSARFMRLQADIKRKGN